MAAAAPRPLFRRIARLLLLLALALVSAVSLAAATNGWNGSDTDFAASPALARSPAPLAEAVTLRLVTFNIADAYLFTTNRAERVRAVAAVLRELDPDLVGLQEAFVARDRALLLRELEGSRLRHEVSFPGATVGNGLWILSAHPIEEAYFHRYAHNGPWYRLWEGDWWAGKGVALARVALPNGALVDFFDTHAQASRENPENEVVRYGQMRELARFVADARAPGAPAFVVGDFNTRPGSPDYELAVREAGLARAMALPSAIDHIFSVRDPRYRVRVLDTVEIGGHAAGSRPAVFLARAPSPRELWSMLLGPPEATALSDHPGYMTTLRVTPATDPAH